VVPAMTKPILIKEAATAIPSRFDVDSFAKTMQRLQRNNEEWFDDEIINGYFYLLSQRFPSVGYLSSYFLAHPHAAHWSNSQQVVKAFQDGLIDKILIPYHLPGHWTLLVIMDNGEYLILDSLGRLHTQVAQIHKWLTTTFSHIKNWRCSVPFNEPHQFDACNCGPYICLYAELVAQGKSFGHINAGMCCINIAQIRGQILQALQSNMATFQQLKPINV